MSTGGCAVKLCGAAPNAALYDLYGLTETGSCDFVQGPPDQPDGFGSIGAPLSAGGRPNSLL